MDREQKQDDEEEEEAENVFDGLFNEFGADPETMSAAPAVRRKTASPDDDDAVLRETLLATRSKRTRVKSGNKQSGATSTAHDDQQDATAGGKEAASSSNAPGRASKRGRAAIVFDLPSKPSTSIAAPSRVEAAPSGGPAQLASTLITRAGLAPVRGRGTGTRRGSESIKRLRVTRPFQLLAGALAAARRSS